MATSTAARLFWSYQAPLAGAIVAHKAFSIHIKDVTACEKASTNNIKLQSRMTSIGHFSVVSETTHNPSIVTFVMALTGSTPLTAQEFSRLWRERAMEERHPRFHKKIVDGSKFIPTDDPVEDHLTETTFPVVPRTDVKTRIQQLQMTPWDLSEKLWHMWIAPWGKLGASGLIDPEETISDADSKDERKGESLLFFRAHHALGDGASMTAAFLDVLDEAAEIQQEIIDFLRKLRKRGERTKGFWQALGKKMKKFLVFLFGSLRALFYQMTLFWHMLWETDSWSQIRKLIRAEEQPQRTVSWSKAAPLEQVKWVAQQLSVEGKKITVNDIFCACVSVAIGKQLSEHRSRIQAISTDSNPTIIAKQEHFNIAFPVHLKGGVVLPGESVGNNLGAFVVRVPGEGDDPEKDDPSRSPSHQRLLQVHDTLATAKSMPFAILSHILAKGFSYASAVLPTRFVGWIYACSNGGSIAVISNNRGLPKPVHLGGRRVEAIYGFVPLPPGIPIGVVVMSYAGNVNLTITAEPWAVPDADQFLVWVLEEYSNLLNAARQDRSHKKL
ncbi:hypothetical protein FisN_16Lh181 [Fistulifera solaris]|uniref:O-acyltransferase WSD1 C-terminal domain-containing protein n=1 Tax=Fistulifera solaris TaxID=1519565 RepID=A0A1Z5KJ61_FISSO|nr:hypothetical protein FisN_16Lh181 [Fistulifera solaris]|eukprot:GAX26340.1 hypothetical protein FisN_16Lh181 [Fistulifera solaris]